MSAYMILRLAQYVKYRLRMLHLFITVYICVACLLLSVTTVIREESTSSSESYHMILPVSITQIKQVHFTRSISDIFCAIE